MANRLQTMTDDFAGLNGHTKDRALAERTARILLPNDPLEKAISYLYGYKDPTTGRWKIPNTCALTAIAALRMYYKISGVYATDAAYIGKYDAVARFEQLGEYLGVGEYVRPDGQTRVADEGDFIRSGDHPAEHVSCLTKVKPDGTNVFCDGGQGLGGEVKIVEAKIIVSGATYLREVGGAIPTKAIRFIFRASRLP